MNSLSRKVAAGASLALIGSSSLAWAALTSNRGSRPETVGRKKGAASGALGGSFGLLRALMVSRFRSVVHRDRGRRERVSRFSESWSGVV